MSTAHSIRDGATWICSRHPDSAGFSTEGPFDCPACDAGWPADNAASEGKGWTPSDLVALVHEIFDERVGLRSGELHPLQRSPERFTSIREYQRLERVTLARDARLDAERKLNAAWSALGRALGRVA